MGRDVGGPKENWILRLVGCKVLWVEERVPAPCTPQGVRTSDDVVYGSLELITRLLGFETLGPRLKRTEWLLGGSYACHNWPWETRRRK